MIEIEKAINELLSKYYFENMLIDGKIIGDSKYNFYIIGNNFAVDFSVSNDYTYDFMIVQTANGEIIKTHTMSFNNLEILLEQIVEDLKLYQLMI